MSGALLLEPTETESKETLDGYIVKIKELLVKIKAGDVEEFIIAPQLAPVKRIDEVLAARKLNLSEPE